MLNFSKEVLDNCKVQSWGYTETMIPLSLDHFQSWLERGDNGTLNYLSGERAVKRESLKNYDPCIESALVFHFSYAEEKKSLESDQEQFKIASYVLGYEGRDYHSYLKEKLEILKDEVLKIYPEINLKFSLDTQPILERDLSYSAGLGWFGKNSMLIERQKGSYFLIGALLLSEKLPGIKTPVLEPDHCGSCTLCIDACPTNAINGELKSVTADKCISTYTIELFKEASPPAGYGNGPEIFGCDICQDVCPWNIKALPKFSEKTLSPRAKELVDFFSKRSKDEIVSDLEGMSNREFRRRFKDTPLERTGRVGLLKNYKFKDFLT